MSGVVLVDYEAYHGAETCFTPKSGSALHMAPYRRKSPFFSHNPAPYMHMTPQHPQWILPMYNAGHPHANVRSDWTRNPEKFNYLDLHVLLICMRNTANMTGTQRTDHTKPDIQLPGGDSCLEGHFW